MSIPGRVALVPRHDQYANPFPQSVLVPGNATRLWAFSSIQADRSAHNDQVDIVIIDERLDGSEVRGPRVLGDCLQGTGNRATRVAQGNPNPPFANIQCKYAPHLAVLLGPH